MIEVYAILKIPDESPCEAVWIKAFLNKFP